MNILCKDWGKASNIQRTSIMRQRFKAPFEIVGRELEVLNVKVLVR